MDEFLLPWLFARGEQMRPNLAHATLEGANLKRVIASREQGLEFTEDVSAGASRVGLHACENLLPLPDEGIFAGAPPVEHRGVIQRLLTAALKG
jgi:hypothetical protein